MLGARGSRKAMRAAARRLFPSAGVSGPSLDVAKGGTLLARYEHAPRHVIEARYLGDYKVWLGSTTGAKASSILPTSCTGTTWNR